MKAIIIDDEKRARRILNVLIEEECPEIDTVFEAENLVDGVEIIKAKKPDIVFLDIEMPNYAGYEIVSFFDKIDFEIIFISAYDQYALKAFEISALDYLLKPIEISRLKAATNKFINRKEIKDASLNYQILLDNIKDDSIKKIIVPYQGGQKIILTEHIIAFEANESYCFIYTSERTKYIVSKNLKHFETMFDHNKNFIRTHKSWLVNINFLKEYSKSNLTLALENSVEAKLSKYKKVKFEALLVTS